LVGRQFPFEVVATPVYGGRQLDSWFGFVGLRGKAITSARLGGLS
jgi:hypothetical protein